jgi:hypothetical protein
MQHVDSREGPTQAWGPYSFPQVFCKGKRGRKIASRHAWKNDRNQRELTKPRTLRPSPPIYNSLSPARPDPSPTCSAPLPQNTASPAESQSSRRRRRGRPRSDGATPRTSTRHGERARRSRSMYMLLGCKALGAIRVAEAGRLTVALCARPTMGAYRRLK